MAKRFTDTDKWKDEWFMDLSPVMKCFWIYLCDTCDCAGIWRVNFKQASFVIGSILDRQSAINALGDRIQVLNDEKWFIEKFIRFQYPKGLSKESKAHMGVIKSLEYHKIETNPYLTLIKGSGNSMDTVQEYIYINNNNSYVLNKKTNSSDTALKPDDLVNLWNTTLVGSGKIKHCHGLSSPDLKEFLTTIGLPVFQKIETWSELFQKISSSEFLRGESGSFTATLNWLVKHENALKVLNGQFSGASNKQNTPNLTKGRVTPDNPTGNPYLEQLWAMGETL